MKALIDIPNAKVPHLMDVLQHISYVKVKPLTDEKALLLSEIKEAVDEMQSIRAGDKQARSFAEFLKELS